MLSTCVYDVACPGTIEPTAIEVRQLVNVPPVLAAQAAVQVTPEGLARTTWASTESLAGEAAAHAADAAPCWIIQRKSYCGAAGVIGPRSTAAPPSVALLKP